MTLSDHFPTRGMRRPAWVPRQQLRPLLGSLRDAAARLLRGRARPEVVADTLHAAARAACSRMYDMAGPQPGLPEGPCGDGLSELEAFSGLTARAALRLGRARIRTRRAPRRV